MVTEVLRPQNCLVDRIRNSPAVFQHRRNSHRKPPSRPDQRRRFGSDDAKKAITESADDLSTEKVTILRRGESLDSKIYREKSPSNNDDGIAAPKPSETAVGDDIYAGSAISVVSPAPSSLPFPSFWRKNNSQVVPVDDSATRDLRRLLRLEL
ncbi:PREDICTED: uncharacterized protein LOC104820224 [Tarenaya hassleriana]|uniref:uncharacterized protein LOC104820224 n=1 Tax=Tarenaya hassleriana TaxID=28532 RepID=UPI00053C920E|nr:PREDICTED: uncharacterized protein LOC104820224 [Tarenaya hassleriana]